MDQHIRIMVKIHNKIWNFANIFALHVCFISDVRNLLLQVSTDATESWLYY